MYYLLHKTNGLYYTKTLQSFPNFYATDKEHADKFIVNYPPTKGSELRVFASLEPLVLIP